MNRKLMSWVSVISLILFFTNIDRLPPPLIHCKTHLESVQIILSVTSIFSAFVTNRRLLTPINTDKSSSLGLVSIFLFGACHTFEKSKLTVPSEMFLR